MSVSAGQGADSPQERPQEMSANLCGKVADRRTLTGDRVNKPFLPSYEPVDAGRKDG